MDMPCGPALLIFDISERIHKQQSKELDFVREVVTTKALEAQKYIDSIGKTMNNRQSILLSTVEPHLN